MHHHRRPPRLWMVTTGMTTVVVTIAMALLLWVPQVSTVPVVVTETIHVAKHDAAANDSPSPAPAETASNNNDIPKQPTPPGGTAAKTTLQHEQPIIPTPLNTTSAAPETPTTTNNNNDKKQHEDTVQEQEPPIKSFGVSAQVQRNLPPETSNSIPQPDPYDEFMTWCHRVLGIQTSLEVHTFYYYDYMAALTWSDGADPEDDDDDDHYVPQRNNHDPHTTAHVQDFPMIPVRGLRATRDIDEGEIVISIPFQALLTVHTTIDQDPVLGRVMGPKARKAYGWTLESDDLYQNNNNNNNNQQQPDDAKHHSPSNDTKAQPTNEDDLDEGPDFFELPLLAMALLHHRKLGTASPMHHYMDILTTTPIHSMPFLWNKQQRRHQHIPGSIPNNHPPQQQGVGWHEMSQETRTVARSIRKEMKEMYHLVVDVLVRDHPELFGKEQPPEQQQQQQEEEDWAFSFDNFQWAFAMVNSRHWQLPIEQKQPLSPPHHQPPQAPPVVSQPQLPTPMSSGVDGVPPAEMPTDAWVEKLEVEEEEEHRPPNNTNGDQSSQETVMTTYHSFLAPVADLLNFGPPCTRGRYNAETHTFDIIASCQFSKGQEVTFWYSDECEDIIIGNYGFTHPMVPKCPKADDYREMRDLWRRRAQTLQEELDNAYEDLDIIDSELQHVQRVLADCHCCDTVAASERYWRQQEEKRLLQQEEQRRMNEIEMHRDSHQQGQEQLHVKYLRKDDANPSQIRGGTMSSSSGNSSTSATNSGRRAGGAASNKHGTRRSQRTDDDVERHGVRRKWMMSNAGRDRRSGL